jgi:tRNA threonylcarbamoyladenosine biosynthesis protein TsaE
MKKTYVLTNLDALHQFAASLAADLSLGTLLTLSGPLGVGKTTLVQALAKALGVTSKVISPTFTIMKIYPLPQGRLLHVDAYRLEGAPSFGLEDEMGEDTITMIEWPEKLNQLPPAINTIHLTLSFIDETTRLVTRT